MDYYIGQIALFSIKFQPRGWVVCDGSLLEINSYQPLFALIGNKFGGNGQTNFAVPNLNSAMFGNEYNRKIKYYIATEGIWPEGVC